MKALERVTARKKGTARFFWIDQKLKEIIGDSDIVFQWIEEEENPYPSHGPTESIEDLAPDLKARLDEVYGPISSPHPDGTSSKM